MSFSFTDNSGRKFEIEFEDDVGNEAIFVSFDGTPVVRRIENHKIDWKNHREEDLVNFQNEKEPWSPELKEFCERVLKMKASE